MKQYTFKVSGMTCEGCAKTVQLLISQNGEIQNTEVDLNSGLLTFKSNSQFTIHSLNNILVNAQTVYRIFPNTIIAKVWINFKPYKFLVLLISLIIISSLVLTYFQGFNLYTLIMNYMGLFLTAFGLIKVFNLSGFVSTFKQYDLIAKRIKFYGYFYPLIEISLGLVMLLSIAHDFANIITLIVYAIGFAGVWLALSKGKVLNCACMGAGFFSLPLGKVTLVEYASMIIMCIFVLI